jgi:hypothetical protein
VRGWTVELSVAGLALLAGLLPTPAPAVERWYSTGVYPRIQHVVTPASNLVPFAVFDLLLLAAIVAVIFALVRVRPVWKALARVALGLALGYLIFLLLWGFNYRRLPMAQRLVLERGAPTAGAVADLGLEAVMRMSELHAAAHEEGWVEEPWRDPGLRDAFAATQRLLADAPLAEPGRLKRTLLAPYFRWTSVDGMVNPFGLEVLANPDLLPFERPFVAGHEWAHLAGYADESDANFVGWLTTIRAGVPAQYSGWLYLFWQVNGEVDTAVRQRLWDGLDPGPRADLEAVIERVRSGQLPWLRTAGWAVYDQYLKANRVESGVRSYGAVITLILRARFEDGWTPVRRSVAADPRSRVP